MLRDNQPDKGKARARMTCLSCNAPLCRTTRRIAGVETRSSLEQQLTHVSMASSSSDTERSEAVSIARVDCSAVGDQELDDTDGPRSRSEVQGC